MRTKTSTLIVGGSSLVVGISVVTSSANKGIKIGSLVRPAIQYAHLYRDLGIGIVYKRVTINHDGPYASHPWFVGLWAVYWLKDGGKFQDTWSDYELELIP